VKLLPILLVDDNEVIHQTFKKIFTHYANQNTQNPLEVELFNGVSPAPNLDFQVEVDSAFQGEEAYQLIQQKKAANQSYAMAFVDIRMPPGWDGLETILKLWEVDPNLMVVICTAFSDFTLAEMKDKLHSGRFFILKKPFEMDEVQQLVSVIADVMMQNEKS